jgi:hypothetical protein
VKTDDGIVVAGVVRHAGARAMEMEAWAESLLFWIGQFAAFTGVLSFLLRARLVRGRPAEAAPDLRPLTSGP